MLALVGGVYLWTRRAQMVAALSSPVAGEEIRWPFHVIAFAGAIAYPWIGSRHIGAVFAVTAALDLADADAYLRRSVRRKRGAYPAASARV